MLTRMGFPSAWARPSASGPHGYQSTGLCRCCCRYGLVSWARWLVAGSLLVMAEQMREVLKRQTRRKKPGLVDNYFVLGLAGGLVAFGFGTAGLTGLGVGAAFFAAGVAATGCAVGGFAFAALTAAGFRGTSTGG